MIVTLEFNGWQIGDPAGRFAAYPFFTIVSEHPRQYSSLSLKSLGDLGIYIPEDRYPSLEKWQTSLWPEDAPFYISVWAGYPVAALSGGRQTC